MPKLCQNTIIYCIITAAHLLHFGCAAPQGDSGGSAPRSNDKKPISTVDSAPCIPSAANNQCKPAAQLTGAEKCWAKILGTDAATKCAAAGKVFNRISGKCMDDVDLVIKAPCTEEQVKSAFQAAGFKVSGENSIESSITQVKKDVVDGIKQDPKFANATVDVVLDQCGETKSTSGTVLIPFYLGKAFSGGADGFGDYRIHAGKVCDKSGTSIKVCTENSLTFPSSTGSPTPVDC